jgi:hypothetical protein
VFSAIDRFEHVILNDNAQQEFAMKAFAIRFPEYVDVKTNQVDYSKVQKNLNVDEILKAVRPEDNGTDLWRVYNRVQEHIIKGGFQHIGQTNKAKATRPLTNIRMNMIVNKGIWQLAEEFAQ